MYSPAKLKKGHLEITIPKTGEAEGKRRKINIASS
jgi:HSP20 family molecular chaperone IbpA